MDPSNDSGFRTLNGVGIDGHSPRVFKVATKTILRMHKMGWRSLYNWKNLPFGLSPPCAILKDVERGGHEHSHCHLAKPGGYGVGEDDADLRHRGDDFVFTIDMMGTFEIYSWK